MLYTNVIACLLEVPKTTALWSRILEQSTDEENEIKRTEAERVTYLISRI